MLAAAGLPLTVVAAGALGPAPAIVEDQDSFLKHATLKARGIARWLAGRDEPGDTLVLADDSGVCVDALDGAPGVDSAVFAGPQADDAANNAHLLAELAARGLDRSPAHWLLVGGDPRRRGPAAALARRRALRARPRDLRRSLGRGRSARRGPGPVVSATTRTSRSRNAAERARRPRWPRTRSTPAPIAGRPSAGCWRRCRCCSGEARPGSGGGRPQAAAGVCIAPIGA